MSIQTIKKYHSPLLIGEVDRVLLVVVLNLFVQFAGLCGQLVDLTPVVKQQQYSFLNGQIHSAQLIVFNKHTYKVIYSSTGYTFFICIYLQIML